MKWTHDKSADYYHADHSTIHRELRRGALRKLGIRWVLRHRGAEVDVEFFTLKRAKAFAEALEKDPNGYDEGKNLVVTDSCSCGGNGPHFCADTPRRLTFMESMRLAAKTQKNGDPGD